MPKRKKDILVESEQQVYQTKIVKLRAIINWEQISTAMAGKPSHANFAIYRVVGRKQINGRAVTQISKPEAERLDALIAQLKTQIMELD
jgi:hypothetical protein